MGPKPWRMRSRIAVAETALSCDARRGAGQSGWPVWRGFGVTAAALLSSLSVIWLVSSATAEASSTPDRVAAGRAFALIACTGCHVVAPDQPFAPDYTGPPPSPDFRSIADMPGMTAESLRRFLLTRLTVSPHRQMADPYLTSEQLEDVVAYIMTLRGRP